VNIVLMVVFWTVNANNYFSQEVVKEMNVTEQIQAISSAVQAVSSVVLIIVTAVYVVITQRILQVPNQSFMKPVGLEHGRDNWTIKVHNFGPGMALNVNVKTVLSNSNSAEELTKEELHRTEHLVVAHGNQELAPSQDRYYQFDSHEFSHFLAYPLIIQWETITGKKQKTVWWLYSGGQRGDFFIKVGLRGRLTLATKICKLYLKRPYKKSAES